MRSPAGSIASRMARPTGPAALLLLNRAAHRTVLAFDIAGDRIKHIWAVWNPEKLRPWTPG